MAIKSGLLLEYQTSTTPWLLKVVSVHSQFYSLRLVEPYNYKIMHSKACLRIMSCQMRWYFQRTSQQPCVSVLIRVPSTSVIWADILAQILSAILCLPMINLMPVRRLYGQGYCYAVDIVST